MTDSAPTAATAGGSMSKEERSRSKKTIDGFVLFVSYPLLILYLEELLVVYTKGGSNPRLYLPKAKKHWGHAQIFREFIIFIKFLCPLR
jgi:hypothetical protein